MKSNTNQYSGVCKKCGAIVEMRRGLVHCGAVYCYPCAPITPSQQAKIGEGLRPTTQWVRLMVKGVHP